MGIFSDILLTVDFDRTLTARDSTIPKRNLEAIQYFMANGGHFTVNTGRSVALFRKLMEEIPVNAPFLLYNGSAAYDVKTHTLSHCKPIPGDMWQILDKVFAFCPDQNLEIQGVDAHYAYELREDWVKFYENQNCAHALARRDEDLGPFLKFSVIGRTKNGLVSDLFGENPEEVRRMDEIEQWLKETFPTMEVFRAAPKIVDVHAEGVSKLQAARELQKTLGKKILICVGDADNDVAMLDGADYAFSPADGVVADRYPNVCKCDDGAVAEVIFKKIPEILGISLDSNEDVC